MPRPGWHVRPWWGLGDVLLGVPLIVVVAFLGTVAGLAFVPRDQLEGVMDGSVDAPVAMLACSLVAQQVAQGLWPWVVSRWKGLGLAADWRLRFKPVDLAIGVGAAIMAFGLAAVAAGIVSSLVNLTDESQAENTQFLLDAKGTPWLAVFLVAAVVGAPLTEELLFRGLVLRAFEKRFGKVVAVIGSMVAFTLPHFTGSNLDGTLVLFASIGAVGLVFGVVTLLTDRLGPAIVAHVLFNAFGAASALGAFGLIHLP
ncbi:MAG: CPBP family intramembrane metalloprotease [Acidimicrobiia bacterium]|nr:CPBP family intramembrane metalloprotease [Acidimicrobiia bacterium]